MKKLFLSIALLAGSAHAGIDLKNLSGAWEVTAGEPKGTLFLVKTDLKTESGATFYAIDRRASDGPFGRFLGVSVEKSETVRPDGKASYMKLSWVRIADKHRYDHESNLVLKVEENHLSLGGDFEQYEVGRLVKTEAK